MSVYEITAPRGYRGHRQRAHVEMVLDPSVERRALRRGDIRLVERSTPCLIEGSYRLPSKAADAAGRGADAHQGSDQGRRANSV